eukprot:354785-Pelagomonas_calceolata.AAC.1
MCSCKVAHRRHTPPVPECHTDFKSRRMKEEQPCSHARCSDSCPAHMLSVLTAALLTCSVLF